MEVTPCAAEGEGDGVREGAWVFWEDVAGSGGMCLRILSWCLSKGEKLQCSASVPWRFCVCFSVVGS